MNRITIMADYLGYELAKAEVSYLEAESDYELHHAKLYLSTHASNKKFAVVAHPSTVEIKTRLDERLARFKLLAAIVEGLDKKYKSLSRELTRRGMEFEKKNHY